MGELPLPAIIAWLVHERFGGYDAETKIFGHMQHGPPDSLADATAYRAHLLRLSEAHVREIYRERIGELLPAARQAVELSESSLFFNRLNAFANFEYWGRFPFWSVGEAASLALGRDPSIVNWAAFEREAATATSFAAVYRRLGDLIFRYVEAGKLDQPIEPSLFVAWCRKMKLPIPPGLVVAVEQHHGREFDLPAAFHRLWEMFQQTQRELAALAEAFRHEVARHAASREQLAALDALTSQTLRLIDAERAEHNAEVAALRREHVAEIDALKQELAAAAGKDLHPRTKENVFKLLMAAVIDGYGYDRTAARSRVPGELVSATEQLGIPLSDETIRTYLRMGAEYLPADAKFTAA